MGGGGVGGDNCTDHSARGQIHSDIQMTMMFQSCSECQ